MQDHGCSYCGRPYIRPVSHDDVVRSSLHLRRELFIYIIDYYVHKHPRYTMYMTLKKNIAVKTNIKAKKNSTAKLCNVT